MTVKKLTRTLLEAEISPCCVPWSLRLTGTSAADGSTWASLGELGKTKSRGEERKSQGQRGWGRGSSFVVFTSGETRRLRSWTQHSHQSPQLREPHGERHLSQPGSCRGLSLGRWETHPKSQLHCGCQDPALVSTPSPESCLRSLYRCGDAQPRFPLRVQGQKLAQEVQQ